MNTSLLMRAARRYTWGLLAAAAIALAALAAGFVDEQEPRAVAEQAAALSANLPAAIAVAAEQGQDVLVLLDASPLEAEATLIDRAVLADAELMRTWRGQFQMVRLPFPVGVTSGGGHMRVCDDLGIQQLPAAVMLDARGRAVGFHQGPGGWETIRARVAGLHEQRVKRDEHLRAAAGASGAAKAMALDAAMRCVTPQAAGSYMDVIGEIVKLDATNAAGLKLKYFDDYCRRRIDAEVQARVFPLIDAAHYGEARGVIQGLIREIDPPGAIRQELLAFAAQLHYSGGDNGAAARMFDEAIAADPSGPGVSRVQRAREMILGNR